MNAKNKNIISQKRNKLEEVIPLSTPYSLVLDPSNVCNFKCKFCAVQSRNEASYFQRQFMQLNIFYKIIDDLSCFPEKLKVLRISGHGEPLLAPNYVEMVQYAKKNNIAEFIETITNGSKLEPDLNQKIIDSGLDRIRISVEAIDSEGYYNMAGVKIDFDKFVDNIKDLYIRSRDKRFEIYIKTVDAAVDTKEKLDKFFNIFGDICDTIFVDKVIPLWSDFEEIEKDFDIKKEGMHGQDFQDVKICPYPFYSLIINPDGQVTMCSADWKRKYVIGDVREETLQDIWNGIKLRTFWKDMLKGRKCNYEMCQKCVLPMYDCNDNIDNYAEEILKNIETQK
ncbi:MAG: SPASM domain-containing protein [Clostridium sp.]|nr:SPASM domain-containing protein [Clostridium sp.]